MVKIQTWIPQCSNSVWIHDICYSFSYYQFHLFPISVLCHFISPNHISRDHTPTPRRRKNKGRSRSPTWMYFRSNFSLLEDIINFPCLPKTAESGLWKLKFYKKEKKENARRRTKSSSMLPRQFWSPIPEADDELGYLGAHVCKEKKIEKWFSSLYSLCCVKRSWRGRK